jgi:hypothetical protein
MSQQDKFFVVAAGQQRQSSGTSFIVRLLTAIGICGFCIFVAMAIWFGARLGRQSSPAIKAPPAPILQRTAPAPQAKIEEAPAVKPPAPPPEETEVMPPLPKDPPPIQTRGKEPIRKERKKEPKTELQQVQQQIDDDLKSVGLTRIARDAAFAYKDVKFSDEIFGHSKVIGVLANLGQSYQFATFTISFWDAEGHLLATSKFIIPDFKRATAKTFETLLKIDRAEAKTFTIQFDSGL